MKLLNAGEVPAGVVAVTARFPSEAPAATEIVMGSEVEVPPLPIDAVTPDPLKETAVAPYRSLPVIVALSVVPGAAAKGEILVMAGVEAGPH